MNITKHLNLILACMKEYEFSKQNSDCIAVLSPGHCTHTHEPENAV